MSVSTTAVTSVSQLASKPLEDTPLIAEQPTASSSVDLKNITNAEFMAAVFPILIEGAFPAICSKKGDPSGGGWPAKRGDLFVDGLSINNNNYLGCSSFNLDNDGSLNVRKEYFVANHCLMLDDLGGKFPLERLGDFEPSWLIETSPGNHQAGIIFSEPLVDGERATDRRCDIGGARFSRFVGWFSSVAGLWAAVISHDRQLV